MLFRVELVSKTGDVCSIAKRFELLGDAIRAAATSGAWDCFILGERAEDPPGWPSLAAHVVNYDRKVILTTKQKKGGRKTTRVPLDRVPGCEVQS